MTISNFPTSLNWRPYAVPHSRDLRDQFFHSFDTSYPGLRVTGCATTSLDFDLKLSLQYSSVYSRESIGILRDATS